MEELLKGNQLTSIILLTLIGSIGFSIKGVFPKIWNLFKVKVIGRFIFTAEIYDFSEFYEMFEMWLAKNYITEYRSVSVWLDSKKSSNKVPQSIYPEKVDIPSKPKPYLSQAPTVFAIKYKGKRILIHKSSTVLNNATAHSNMHGYSFKLSGYMAKKVMVDLFTDVIEEFYNSFGENTIRVKSHTSYGSWEESHMLAVKPIDKIFIEKGDKEELLEDLKVFTNSKEWYEDRGIPYKRGYVLYGPPGTGKTSLCLAIASHLKRDVYTVNLKALLNDNDLIAIFRRAAAGSVIIIEDIDVYFTGREKGKEECKVSFSTLLNCLDGAFYKEDTILIITTNKIETLDPALLRPGRIDKKIEVTYPSVDTIERYMTNFYKEVCVLNSDMVNITVPMAKIQEICITNRFDVEKARNVILQTLNKQEDGSK